MPPCSHNTLRSLESRSDDAQRLVAWDAIPTKLSLRVPRRKRRPRRAKSENFAACPHCADLRGANTRHKAVSVTASTNTTTGVFLMLRHIFTPLALVLFALVVFALGASRCQAEKSADLKPLLARSPKLAFEDEFQGAALGDKWKAVKGTWQIKDGAVVGSEKKEDQHAAVLNCSLPNHDSAIQFSFKLDGCQFFHLSFNKAKGHLFRVIVARAALRSAKTRTRKTPTRRPSRWPRPRARSSRANGTACWWKSSAAKWPCRWTTASNWKLTIRRSTSTSRTTGS